MDDQIRQKKLQSALQTKKELEEKIHILNESISLLDQKEPKKTAKELFEENKKKEETFVEQIKKFSNSNKQTENKLKSQSEKLKRKVKQLEEQDLILAEKMREMREQTRKEEQERLKEKREQRTRNLETMKSTASSPIPKPLYQKLEDIYKQKVEMPELEKRKEILNQKKNIFAPMKPGFLDGHMKWYDDIQFAQKLKQENSRRERIFENLNRSTSVQLSSWGLSLIEEDKKKEKERQMKIEEKLKRLEKKAKYSEVIAELRVNPPKKEASFSSDVKPTREKALRDSASVDSVNWKPHKFPVNHMVPQPKAAKEIKPLLYLEEKRKERLENCLSPDSEEKLLKNLNSSSAKQVISSVGKLEEIIRKKEIFSDSKPLSRVSIAQTAKLEDLMLASIKAKLKIIEQNTS